MPLKDYIRKHHQKPDIRRLILAVFSVMVLLWPTTIIPFPVIANQEDEIHYHFTQTDSGYSFYGSFKLFADPKCILAICFNPDDLIKLAPDAKEVTLTGQGSDWNQLRYTYRKYLFFENSSVWNRQLDEDRFRVDFSLVWSENNLSIMPEIVSSSGFYQISLENDLVLVEYYQSCIITEVSLSGFYIDNMKKEAASFLQRFSEYAGDHCNVSKSMVK